MHRMFHNGLLANKFAKKHNKKHKTLHVDYTFSITRVLYDGGELKIFIILKIQ